MGSVCEGTKEQKSYLESHWSSVDKTVSDQIALDI